MKPEKLHQEAFVLDSHCDTPLKLIEGEDLSSENLNVHFDFERMKRGGVDTVFFAIYTSNKLEPDAATRRALQLIARTYDAVEENSEIKLINKVAHEINRMEAGKDKDTLILAWVKLYYKFYEVYKDSE
jgi:membrane dipeptidase